jgi:hypothetical protein
MTDTDLAAEAHLYGFALVFNLEQVIRATTVGFGTMQGSPFNSFTHATTLATAADTFVSVNNDTVYSLGQLDLGVGPLVLHVPDAAGRYHVLQFVDAWTNNFAYVGTRATGDGPADYFLTPPGWSGEVPDGMTRIAVPTRVATIVGRWACDGEDDLPAVAALQEALTLRPHAADAPDAVGVPAPDHEVADDLLFFEKARTWIAAFPPSDAEQELQARFAPLGLLDDESPYRDPSDELRATLIAGVQASGRQMEEVSRHGGTPVNGWQVFLHIFDYNLDHFELGTIDDPAWKIADRTTAHAIRAVAARVGLWGNHAYEAAYVQTYLDDQGEQLNGSRRYELHFDDLPPVGAFWSLTMYDMPDYFLVDNPIARYSIGDRTPGIRYGDDGSLTITMSTDEPGDAANWLPAPAGDFRPMIRMYMPGEAVLDGRYQLPAIRRLA